MDDMTLLGIKAGISAVLAALTAVWGWFGWLVVAWVLLMLSDWLIGSAAAAKEGRWASSKMREGAWHKGGMILVVAIALVADWLIGTIIANIPGITLPFTYSVLLGPLVIVWYVIGELGSLAEHAVTFGAPVPGWLTRILEISKNAVDTAGDKLTGGEEQAVSAGDGSGDTEHMDE
jgi:phage-related holin|nr:phage holin family protein [uncultured Oscillibacter sp.]DAZ27223.1 MAG TPA: holin [Caudoviricetes sp.]